MKHSLSLSLATVPAAIVAAALGVAVGMTTGAGAEPAGASEQVPTPHLVVGHLHHGGHDKGAHAAALTVAWNKPLTFSLTDGTLTAVKVTGDRGPVRGRIGSHATRWKATEALIPRLDYTAALTYRDLAGAAHQQAMTLHAADSGRRLNVAVSPARGATVGVGMPVSVTFGRDVPIRLRDRVVEHLAVRTSPHVAGAWHWMSARDLHWRPRNFWPPQTSVSVSSNLSKVYFGDGFWGGGGHRASFRIGAAHVSVANVHTHQMVISAGGHVVRKVPISTGRAKYPTMNGAHVVLDKTPNVIMDSATVGIPRNSPDGYYEHVKWDTRISNSGEFVHAAPWSAVEQGHRNVSHGCLNVSTAQARWFYHFSRPGDVVKVVGSRRAPLRTDPGTMDWNMSWVQWRSG
jgi:lipoprotein-anchoring transpeptidase ErfK/SrfK